KFGVDIIRKALEEPIRWIAQNGGWEGSIVVNKVREGQGAFGFNAATGQYEDLLQAGVIDPTKVSRFALQNSASVASLMLTTEADVEVWHRSEQQRREAAHRDQVQRRSAIVRDVLEEPHAEAREHRDALGQRDRGAENRLDADAVNAWRKAHRLSKDRESFHI